MVYVRLARDWSDATGADHKSGDMVDVDAVTLAELEATGVVESGASTDWAGPTGGTTSSTDWAGPTGGETASTSSTDWAGPTGGGTG